MSEKERAIEYLENLIRLARAGDIEFIQFNLKIEEQEMLFFNYNPPTSLFYTFNVLYKDKRGEK